MKLHKVKKEETEFVSSDNSARQSGGWISSDLWISLVCTVNPKFNLESKFCIRRTMCLPLFNLKESESSLKESRGFHGV